MNKQEAIERLEEKKSSFNAWENLVRNRALDDALDIVKQLDEPEKPVVPQFVADFYESIKDDFEDKVYDLCVQFNVDNEELCREVEWWFNCSVNKPIETLVNMHQFGYEVYEKKLYTVEIPNPNGDGYGVVYLGRNEYNKTELRIWDCYSSIDFADNWKQKDNAHLTESEIKEDFEWAWPFAEEV